LLILENARTGFASAQFSPTASIDGVLTSLFSETHPVIAIQGMSRGLAV